MKRCTYLLAILALALALGCEKLQSPASPIAKQDQQKSLSQDRRAFAEAKAKFETIGAKLREVMAQRQATRLSKLGAASSQSAEAKKITVPDDYPAIQQAVDAAMPGDKITVKTGTYTEFVYVDVPNVSLSAVGTVTVKGSLIVTANDVMIDRFNIEVLTYPTINIGLGVFVFGASIVVSGVEIKGNTISGGDAGVALQLSNSCTVKDNQVSGASQGGIGLLDADDHIFDGNTLTGNLVGIYFLSGCDNNQVLRNNCSSNVAGILLEGAGNQLSNNTCNGNSELGIQVITASDNTIGSGNAGNNNGSDGLRLETDATNNVVEKNTFLHNAGFDINNLGSGNTFIKNKANNTNGV